MNQEKSLNAKQVPYMDARERVMGYTQFLKRYWAWENGITLYKDPKNHGGPWGRYEEISDSSFEENIVKQCGTRGTKLIKCIKYILLSLQKRKSRSNMHAESDTEKCLEVLQYSTSLRLICK